jgi:hypothetical protein
VGRDGAFVDVIWVKREQKCFCKWDWTAQIRLIGFNKSRFSGIFAEAGEEAASLPLALP